MSRPDQLFQHYLNEIKKHIEAGYAAGERLPSYREFADMFDITTNMSFRIVQHLIKSGLISSNRGKRTRSAGANPAPAVKRPEKLCVGLISAFSFKEWETCSPLYPLLAEEAARRSISIVEIPHRYACRPTLERRRIQWERIPWNEFDVGLLLDVEDYASLAHLKNCKRPLISVDNDATSFGISSVCFDDFNAGWQAGEYLARHGHLRCGVTVQRNDRRYPWDTAWLKRRHGFESAVGSHSAFFQAAWYMDLVREDDRGNRPYIRHWLEKHCSKRDREWPSALFAVNPFLEAIVSECNDLGIHISKDLSIVSVANAVESAWVSDYRFTHLHANYQALARRALDLAEQLIAPENARQSGGAPLRTLASLSKVAMKLVVGNTVRRAGSD